jgi:hypothetical protein
MGHKKNSDSFASMDAVIGVNKLLVKVYLKELIFQIGSIHLTTGKRSSRSGSIIAIGRLEKVKGFDQLIKKLD